MIRSRVEEMPLRAITSVGSRRRVVNGHLEVTVAGDEEVWHMTSASHFERVSAFIRAQVRGIGAG